MEECKANTNAFLKFDKFEELVTNAWFPENFSPFLSLQEIGRIDSALTNKATRKLWLKSPKHVTNQLITDDKAAEWCESKNLVVFRLVLSSAIESNELTNVNEAMLPIKATR